MSNYKMSEIGDWDASTEISVLDNHPSTLRQWLKKISVRQEKKPEEEIKKMRERKPAKLYTQRGLDEYALIMHEQRKAMGWANQSIAEIKKYIVEDEAWIQKRIKKRAERNEVEIGRDMLLVKYGMFLVYLILLLKHHLLLAVDNVITMLEGLKVFVEGDSTAQLVRFLQIVPGVFYVEHLKNKNYLIRGPRSFAKSLEGIMRDAENAISEIILGHLVRVLSIDDPSLTPPLIITPEKKLLILRHLLSNLGKKNKKKEITYEETRKKVVRVIKDYIPVVFPAESVEKRELRIKRNREFEAYDEFLKKIKKEKEEKKNKEKKEKKEEEKRERMEKLKSCGVSGNFYCICEEGLKNKVEERRLMAKQGDATPVEVTKTIWLFFTNHWMTANLVLFEGISKATIIESMKKRLLTFPPRSMTRRCLGIAIGVLEEAESIKEFSTLYFNHNLDL